MAHRKNAYFFFEISSPLIFARCFILSAARVLEIMVFGTPWPILRLWAPKFLVRGCDRTAGFYHVLSVFVVLSVSVKSAMECQMTCLMKCFLRCVSERYDVKSQRSLFFFFFKKKKKNRLRRERKPLACAPKHCRFSRTSHGCLPTSCDTRGSKVPAILRDWQEQDTERTVL